MRPRLFTALAGVAALLGLVFATVSTYDFMAHLDRQVHGVNCSFLPGISNPDTSGTSGCHVTLMSPYSSMFREQIWGGIPVSLAGMAVFAFLLFWAAHIVLTRRQDDPRATGLLALGFGAPVIASLVMGYLSLAVLDAACKLCIGIYVASALGFMSAIAAWVRALSVRKREARYEDAQLDDPRQPHAREHDESRPAGASWLSLAGVAALGIGFVIVPVMAYAATAPEFDSYIGTCGELPEAEDKSGVLVSVGPQSAEVSALEVLDPLCPACRGFEARFHASSVSESVRRRLLLFPLDDECNWMIDDAIHPGACSVSEAVLCADRPEEVLQWAFEHQEQIMEASGQDPDAAERMVQEQFPGLAGCVGSAKARARLNQGLRWSVDNRLPVLTPQFYVEGVKMCDEDTDLGMDYMLSRMVARAREGRLGS